MAKLMKELKKMLRIEIGLSIAFYSQTDRQTECINQELEQYLQFFVDYRQKDWPKWLVSIEFVVNNKTYLVTKISLFIANYESELKIEANIRQKRKIEKTIEFTKRMKRIQKKAETVLRKVQEKIKRQTNRKRKEAKVQKKENRVMLNIKDLVFKE